MTDVEEVASVFDVSLKHIIGITLQWFKMHPVWCVFGIFLHVPLLLRNCKPLFECWILLEEKEIKEHGFCSPLFDYTKIHENIRVWLHENILCIRLHKHTEKYGNIFSPNILRNTSWLICHRLFLKLLSLSQLYFPISDFLTRRLHEAFVVKGRTYTCQYVKLALILYDLVFPISWHLCIKNANHTLL